jgi:hypothetical protein
MSTLGDLATLVIWPLLALTLVLCGMTIATSGHPSTGTTERRAPADDPAGRGGRRATDRLPGERTMVVVTGETSATTVANAISAARGGSTADVPVDVVGDPRRPHPRWESIG